MCAYVYKFLLVYAYTCTLDREKGGRETKNCLREREREK